MSVGAGRPRRLVLVCKFPDKQCPAALNYSSIPLNRNRSTLQPLSVGRIHPEQAPHPEQEKFPQFRGFGLTRSPAALSIRLQRVVTLETDCAP